MKPFIRKRAWELKAGDVVRVEEQTLWGWQHALHTVHNVQCELDSRCLSFELRDGPTLRQIVRGNEDREFIVRRESAQIIPLFDGTKVAHKVSNPASAGGGTSSPEAREEAELWWCPAAETA